MCCVARGVYLFTHKTRPPALRDTFMAVRMCVYNFFCLIHTRAVYFRIVCRKLDTSCREHINDVTDTWKYIREVESCVCRSVEKVCARVCAKYYLLYAKLLISLYTHMQFAVVYLSVISHCWTQGFVQYVEFISTLPYLKYILDSDKRSGISIYLWVEKSSFGWVLVI